jgi:hypothetical protein
MVSEHFGTQKLLEFCCKEHERMLVLDVSDRRYVFEAPNLHTQAKGSWYAHPEETLLAPYCVFCILAVALLGKCCHSRSPLPALTTTNACQCHSNNHPKIAL